MAAFRKMLLMLGVVAILLISGLVFVNFYSYIFSRRVVGVIHKVERVQVPMAVLQGQGQINPQIFSFAVAIKEASGEIVTASAEDRQWAVAQAGQCAEAVFYPYPPWKLDKANTYYGARLEKLSDCQGQQPQPSTEK